MISENIYELMLNQVNAELNASYLYLSMAAYFENKNLRGLAKWMRKQSEEEREHAMKFYDYLVTVGKKVVLKAIPDPKTEWSSVMEVWQDTLNHEKKVTNMINNIMKQAIEDNDYASINFLNWFVDEQIEEVTTAEEIIAKFEMIGDSKQGLYLLDKELGERKED
ncbi:MAG: ferritin [Ignavibacterium sp.]|nr:ferritin [Ignavibacterium sp.]MDW8375112.1 ferritin [Ignavibacteriales bacterium]